MGEKIFRNWTIYILLLSCILAIILIPATAGALMIRHAIGIDGIRLIDKAQYDGMFNFFYQGSLNNKSAFVVGYSSGDEASIIDLAYKMYMHLYSNGIFYQLGAVYIDEDNDDSEMGVSAAIGYEKKLSPHVVVGGAVKIIAGVENPVTGDEDPLYHPVLNLIIAF
ncbi:MAG: hypothetical protein ACMUJM_14445 [bacterium]